MIISFKSDILKALWVEGDTSLLSNLYVYQVIDILDFLDDAISIHDLEAANGFKVEEYLPNHWSVTVTVNNVEPIGSVVCHFHQSNAYEVDLNEYD